MEKQDIKSMTLGELQALMAQMGEAKFRAKQIFGWLHEKQVSSFSEMTNLSQALRTKLEAETKIGGVTMVERLLSREDGTRKYLFALENGSVIESVLMQYDYGNTVCVSTQAGCRMGCRFCASTLDGVERSLTASEMLSQVYEIQKDLGRRISGVVLMGSGEPLDNYENVLRFLRLLNDPSGQNMGQRHMTLSTCGLIDKIYDLAEENLQITLAVSLHAPNDEIRRQIMPVAKANPMDRLLKACVDYANHTKRRITFEYALIQGVNDSDACARELGAKLHGTLCHVNLIPMNPVKERDFTKSSAAQVQRFAQLVQQSGVETTIRRRLGSDIDAACGQLRRKYMQK
ncbi:23S rRNA (adenine(2503)-C(2))-methyltransferase RlmN [Anaerotignum lactatifermentans]|uniref:Probable dual-specificity RNA methyltransferase RlmN n=1 Tax=Anaerotignum lactatifermentans TaxID=160404 RepID=A0ABS2GCW0_9FIRM|nr:23S rRNA (adenine(2503)-C(2))-methyltransferase RlmN [Anaerotignum lactatifermentans]MBM6830153.1 23S rRNA (adenine(2503)-C(2))-methyltransferase RlmN [Anaerotignum lactatifermentans]MBM6878702.1 23S rRNA (adenine(2503)-C(2))-methyltransferase RlmN [Anaerotignum lactatifermentans]MBM6951766.1 23S rRNA (adenine(2503)-C(2))-methyltransferase RlmN [Anaerotignum lactatifermentans]